MLNWKRCFRTREEWAEFCTFNPILLLYSFNSSVNWIHDMLLLLRHFTVQETWMKKEGCNIVCFAGA